MRGLLNDLKQEAQKSGDFQEYRSFVEQFHSIGAVSDAEFVAFKKELDGFLSKSAEGGKDDKEDTNERLDKKFKNENYEKVGDAYIRLGKFGETTDDIVRIDKNGEATKRIVSSKSGYTREIVLEKTPITDALQEEGKINESLSDIGNKLAKLAGYKKEQDILANKPDRTEKEERHLKDLESISKTEQELVAEKTRLETEKKRLPKPDVKLQETQAEKEEKAREVIDFVDDMGLHTLGVENVDKFFELVGQKSVNGKIDAEDGLDPTEKSLIKKEFARLLGAG